ncbi:MAG: hypothetical protein COA58_00110 [Bacteroidetes bacterium]|nr:MAG: hypothetical protein COA58_00110 [Bacteroidota bacterium]
MKHFIAILAHKNGAHLELLVKECKKRNYVVRIHLDKKSRSKILKKHPYLLPYTLEQSIDVSRGHFSIVEASMLLLNASNLEEFDYFHLISGEDYITKSEEEFEHFFTGNQGTNFINNTQLPIESEYPKVRSTIFSKYATFKDRVPLTNYQHAFFKNGIGLVDTYHFRPSGLISKVIKWTTPTYQLRQFYLKLFKRKLPKKEFYAGSAWFSVTKDMTLHFSEQTQDTPSLYAYFRNVLFPDEIYFHTIALNSSLKETIINSDLRYINWDKPVQEGPGLLTVEDIYEIKKSNGFFARKCDLANNTKLKEQIENELF